MPSAGSMPGMADDVLFLSFCVAVLFLFLHVHVCVLRLV
jgi:hypothetical protein